MTLPTDVSHDRVIRALERAGFIIREGAKHSVGRKDRFRVSIPRHRRIRLSTLARIVRQAGITLEEFRELL